jgi:MFS family permease
MTQPKSKTPGVRAARIAVFTMFMVNGAMVANWVSRIPQVQADLELSEGQLGIVLLGLAAGVLTALSLAGGLVNRHGSRRVTFTASVFLCALLPFLGLMPNAIMLWVNLFLFGMSISLMDIAMNAQAVEVEQLAGQPLMSAFHGSYSIGGFIGAAIGAAMASLDFTPFAHFMIASTLFLALSAGAARYLLVVEPTAGETAHNAVFQLPPRLLWPLGAVAFAGAIGEGAMADWSGVYLSTIVKTDAGVAALGFAIFSILMTVGRLSGDRLTEKYTAAPLVRFGGGIAAAGILLAIMVPEVPTTLLGFAAVGLGVSIVMPLAFSAAGNVASIPASSGIAGVATIGYAGFLAGPPVIGVIAEYTSLRMAMLLVALLVSSLVFTAGSLSVKKTAPSPA